MDVMIVAKKLDSATKYLCLAGLSRYNDAPLKA